MAKKLASKSKLVLVVRQPMDSPPAMGWRQRRRGVETAWNWADGRRLHGPKAGWPCDRCGEKQPIGYWRSGGDGWHCANCTIVVYWTGSGADKSAIVYLPTNEGGCITVTTSDGTFIDERKERTTV